MAGQNIIATGQLSYLEIGTKTITAKITVPTAGAGATQQTSWGMISPKVSTLYKVNGSATESVLTLSPNTPTADFARWWGNNPFYISRINLQCSDAAYLPTQLVFKTKNVFTGETSTQIVDVSANIVSTQYQSGIVTLQTNILCGRDTEIDILGTTTAAKTISLNMTITHYASLEKGLESFINGENAE